MRVSTQNHPQSRNITWAEDQGYLRTWGDLAHYWRVWAAQAYLPDLCITRRASSVCRGGKGQCSTATFSQWSVHRSSLGSLIYCGLSDSGGCQLCLAHAGVTSENTDKCSSENTQWNKSCTMLHARITPSHSAPHEHSSQQYHWAPPTCGGGRPPAPGGHTGSIFLIFSLLHSQDGEGFSMLQFPFRKISSTDSGTEAVVHSFCPTVQGVSLCLEKARKKQFLR